MSAKHTPDTIDALARAITDTSRRGYETQQQANSRRNSACQEAGKLLREYQQINAELLEALRENRRWFDMVRTAHARGFDVHYCQGAAETSIERIDAAIARATRSQA